MSIRWIWFLGWILQGIIGVVMPLLADEAYYLDWSKHLALGYFDHPPAIAWLIALCGGSPRLAAWLAFGLTSVFLMDAARRWGAERPFLAPAIVVWTPLGFSAGVIATPDIPLVLAWSAVIWTVAARRPWLGGVAVAVGLYSKSTIVPALVGWGWILIQQQGWAALGPMGLALVLYVPHLGWSYFHDGLPWSFQASRTWRGFSLPEAVGGQLLVVGPVVLGLTLARWWKPVDERVRRLCWLGAPSLVFWMGMACLTRVEANWACLAWPAAALTLAITKTPRWLLPAVVFPTALAAFALPILDGMWPTSGPPRSPERWAACVESFDSPVVGGRYQEVALLAAAGVSIPYLHGPEQRSSQYDLWEMDFGPLCDFTYLGDAEMLGNSCSSVAITQTVCGRETMWCGCEASSSD